MKVFLGGTCSGYKWRDDLIPMLNCDYYNSYYGSIYLKIKG